MTSIAPPLHRFFSVRVSSLFQLFNHSSHCGSGWFLPPSPPPETTSRAWSWSFFFFFSPLHSATPGLGMSRVLRWAPRDVNALGAFLASQHVLFPPPCPSPPTFFFIIIELSISGRCRSCRDQQQPQPVSVLLPIGVFLYPFFFFSFPMLELPVFPEFFFFSSFVYYSVFYCPRVSLPPYCQAPLFPSPFV